MEDRDRTAIGMAIPIFIMGGFHVDSFKDTMNAIESLAAHKASMAIYLSVRMLMYGKEAIDRK